ncbi:MAG: glycosyltransferase family 2 protein [Pseudomonadota bacterium]
MKVTIVTTMRNEGAHALEWVAHHRAAGVSDFLVYVNDCEDGTEELLSLLPGVHVIRHAPRAQSPQWAALRAAWDHPVVQQADWLACLDCDEFININSRLDDIPDLIERSGADAILMPWRLFGSNGHVALSPEPVTERFTYAAAPDMLYPAIGRYFKTLFRRDGPFHQFGVHRPKHKKDGRNAPPVIVDGSGAAVPPSLLNNSGQIMMWDVPIARDLVQLNHYSVKSAADFMVKRERGLPNHTEKEIGLTYWVERNFNHVEDATIAHMRAATARQEDLFLELPDVALSQKLCRAWNETEFERVLSTPDGLQLFGRLQLANASAEIDPQDALALIKAYRRVNARR